MPLKFWDEAFLTATYLINFLPSKVIKFETPITRLFGTIPDYKSLRIFGCACWPNLRPYNVRKLAFRSKRCVFLGYSPIHKGVKCLDVSTGRVYISRDVVFDESVFPFESLHPNAGAILRKEILLLPSNLWNFEQGGDNCTDQNDDSTSSGIVSMPVQVPGDNSAENGMENYQNPPENKPIFHVLEEEEAGTEFEADLEQPATPAPSDHARRSTSDRAPTSSQQPAATSPGAGLAPRPTRGQTTARSSGHARRSTPDRASTGSQPQGATSLGAGLPRVPRAGWRQRPVAR